MAAVVAGAGPAFIVDFIAQPMATVRLVRVMWNFFSFLHHFFPFRFIFLHARNTVYLVLAAVYFNCTMYFDAFVSLQTIFTGAFGRTHSVALLFGSLIQTAIRKNYFRTRWRPRWQTAVFTRLHFMRFRLWFTLCGGICRLRHCCNFIFEMVKSFLAHICY